MSTITRRTLFGRAVAILGVPLMTQKFPSGISHYGSTAESTQPRQTFVITGCVFVHGDPSQNDPEWIEDHGSGLILRGRTMQIDGALVFSHPVSITVMNNGFFDVPVRIQENVGKVWWTNNIHTFSSKSAMEQEAGR